jgi:hypothetical protein
MFNTYIFMQIGCKIHDIVTFGKYVVATLSQFRERKEMLRLLKIAVCKEYTEISAHVSGIFNMKIAAQLNIKALTDGNEMYPSLSRKTPAELKLLRESRKIFTDGLIRVLSYSDMPPNEMMPLIRDNFHKSAIYSRLHRFMCKLNFEHIVEITQQLDFKNCLVAACRAGNENLIDYFLQQGVKISKRKFARICATCDVDMFRKYFDFIDLSSAAEHAMKHRNTELVLEILQYTFPGKAYLALLKCIYDSNWTKLESLMQLGFEPQDVQLIFRYAPVEFIIKISKTCDYISDYIVRKYCHKYVRVDVMVHFS